MNKQCYRVVFNKARGMFMVVSEITKSQNKTAGNGSSKKSTAKSESQSGTTLSYSRLAVAILCCQSMIYTQVQAANSQIQNTASNVPAAQRAALLKSTNGTPIVNIRTPNSKGLSHNTYNQFDIGSNGAILNNSIGGANTQLAGAIAGNQYLAKTAANTILNEVRSNAPAKFQGNIEVAGQRADVIIASPSGLQIQGGGFINANQATLTTGTPKIDSAGNLTGFDVKQGQIQFDNATTGNALGGDLYDGKNKNQANYVDILARAVTINGQIHANQDVDMVIGSNTVDYDTGEATKITGTGTVPTLAVDVSTLGGIYANSINLVGTENGLGVRNAGNIQANQQIVLTNSGKIENKGDIKTTKAQTSLLSINATGNAGSIDHSGTISSYGMIDMQADKDITLDAGIVKKNSAGTAVQLMPDIIRIDAGGSLKVSNISDIRNKNVDDQTNIYTHSTLDTIVDSKSAIASNGGVSIDGDRYVHLLDTSSTSAGVAALNISSKSGTTVDNATVAGSGDVYINSRTADTTVSNNSQLSAKKSLTIGAGRDATLKTGSRIIGANDLTIAATRNATVDTAGSIKVTNDAVVQAGELAYLKNISQPTNIGKQLIIQGKQATVLNSTANANEGIYINSQGKDTTITNSNLNSTKGAVTAIANQAALKVNKLNTNANSTILAATGDVSIVGSTFTTDNLAIESGQNLTATQLTTVNRDIKQTGSIHTKSKGTTDITSSQLKNTGNITVSSDKYLTIIDTDIDSGKNLSLQTKQNIYSNISLDKNAEGVAFNNYDVSTKQNTFTAAEVLSLDSTGRQAYKDTDFKGSAILSNAGSNYILSTNLNLTATGASKNVNKNINGNIQIVNEGTISLNKNHTISAQKDLTIQAGKGITVTKAPKIVAQNIALKTTVASTAKSDKGINNTYGDGDISIIGTELSATGSTGNGLVIDAANHLNVIDSQTKSVGSTTMKSGNLMRLNNSTIESGKNIALDSQSQIIFNGERSANTNSSLNHINTGKVVLNADEILSINSQSTQSYKDIDASAGAILVNSVLSKVSLNDNVDFDATGGSKLAQSKEKLSDGKDVKTLNGDLSVSSYNDLIIDPKLVKLHSKGDLSLTSRNGQLYLKGHALKKASFFSSPLLFGNNDFVELIASGDINLTGKEVLIEGANLNNGYDLFRLMIDSSKIDYSSGDFQKQIDVLNAELEKKKETEKKRGVIEFSPAMGGINITATNGDVKLKGIKNGVNDIDGCEPYCGFFNYVSPHRVQVIEDQIKLVNSEIASTKVDTKLSVQARNGEVSKLQGTLSDLNKILEISKQPSKGYEHKAVEINSFGTVNISAQNGGVLLEGTNVNSIFDSINILAKGNLDSINVTDDNNRTDTYNDSIRITGLADVFQQGDMNGSNYSYHQIINQPKLKAKGNIQISGQGDLVKSSNKYDSKTKSYISNNGVVLNSADVISTNGNIRIDASEGDINLEASQAAFMDGSQTSSTSRKWYGKKKTTTTTVTSNNSNAVTTDLEAKNISLTADGNIKAYGSDLVAAPTGVIKLSAGNGLYLYSIDNVNENSTDIKKKSSFLGVRYNKEHTNDTRQELSQLPAKLIGGKAYTASGSDTLLEGTVFNTLKSSDIQVGVGKYADDAAKLILAPITNQITITHNQEKESTVWMKTVDQGSVVTTAQLPKFNQVPTITSPNGVIVAVPVEVTVDSNAKAKAAIQKSQEELGKIALNLSKQPGYEYLAALDKTNDINWAQVDLIQKNWNYTQEGLTPGAAALIAIAVAVAAGPAGSGLSASMVATNAAGIALQTQAVITLINNKGDISKTLKDMASSDTIRNMATAALTAGLTAKLNLPQMANNDFANKLVNGVAEGATSAFVNAAFNGVSLEDALKNSLRSSLVDVFSAEIYSGFVKDFDTNEFSDNLAHKLVAAGVGCVSASAKKQDCDAGAIGAAVGEMLGDYLVDDSRLLTVDEEKKILDYSKLLAGSVALITNVDVDTAASSATIAVKNNALQPPKGDRKFLGGAVTLLEQAAGGLAGAAVSVGKIGEPFIHPIDTYEGLKQFTNQDEKWIAIQLAVAYDLQTRADNYNMHAANGSNFGMGMESAINTLDAVFIGASIAKVPSGLLSALPALKTGARVTYKGATYILKNGKIVAAKVIDSSLRPSVPWKSQIGAVGNLGDRNINLNMGINNRVAIQSLDNVPASINVSKLRKALSPSWFKSSYQIDNLSISVAEIKTATGSIERVMAVNGKAWHGNNAPKESITWQGNIYNIVFTDPKNLPTNVNNINHAEKRIFEYINANYSNQPINVKIAVENTSARSQGMCSGCSISINDLSNRMPKMTIQMFQGSTGRNP